MSSAGSPEWQSSQSITAARPDSSTIRLPSRKSPWTRHSLAGRGGGLSRSQRSPASTAGSGSPISSIVASHSAQAASAGSASGDGDAVYCSGVDRVDSRERLPELCGQRGAGHLQLLAPQHARRDRGPLDVVHHEAGALQAPACRLEGEAVRHRDPGGSRRLHHSKLGLEGRKRVLRAHRIAAEHPAPALGLGEERLPRGPAGDRATAQRTRVGARRLGDQLANAGRERVLRRRRHGRARTAPSGGPGCPPGPCTSTRCTDPGRSPPADRTDRPGSRST